MSLLSRAANKRTEAQLLFSMSNLHLESEYYYSAADRVHMPEWEKICMEDYDRLMKNTSIIPDTIGAARLNANRVNILDMGCGTGMWWKKFYPSFPDDICLGMSLLDCSQFSLDTYGSLLEGNEAVTTTKIKTNVEKMASVAQLQGATFDVIWSLHSLYTVDPEHLPSVFSWVVQHLKPGGKYWDLHLCEDSFYNDIECYYHSVKGGSPRFLTAERFRGYLTSVMSGVEEQEITLSHRVHKSDHFTLEKYINKMVFDNDFGVDAAASFISRYLGEDSWYSFPQKEVIFSWTKPC